MVSAPAGTVSLHMADQPRNRRAGSRPATASESRRAWRRRTRFWFIVYFVLLLGIAAASLAGGQWSVAITTIAIAAGFGLYIRRLWRKR